MVGKGMAPAPLETPAVTSPQIAYTYSFAFELPADAVATLQQRHLDACLKAGPTQCEVVSSSLERASDTAAFAQLTLRMAPARVAAFRAALPGEADALDGRLRSSNVSSEDLTRMIVDTTARIDAQTTLRNRLQALIADRPGRLGDLLEIERELARVQQELDSARSQMAVMRQRVDLSVVSLQYTSEPISVGDTTFEPLKLALTGFLGLAATSLASMIQFVAVALPWLLLVGGAVWALLAWRRRRQAARLAGQTQTQG
jgi:hypothetical protein